jgi:hypothetical protein
MPVAEQPQHMQALANANRIRGARAALKSAVRAGDRTVAEILGPDATLPSEAESMTVSELLCCRPRWGKTVTRRFLERLMIGELVPLSALTLRQRKLIVEEPATVPQPKPEAPLPQWLDGPGVAEWLRGARSGISAKLPEGLRQCVCSWSRPGARASVFRVDEVLIALDLHLADVPEHLYLTPRGRR